MSKNSVEIAEKGRKLFEEISVQKSDYDRGKIFQDHIDDENWIPQEILDEIVEEEVDNIKHGISEHTDDIKDALRDEIIDEYESSSEKTAAIQPQWVWLAQTAAKNSARQAATALRDLVEILDQSNSIGVSDSLLTKTEKEGLIAVLKATINELEGPVVDRGRAKQMVGWFGNILKRQTNKVANETVGEGFSKAKDALTDVLSNSPSEGPPNLF